MCRTIQYIVVALAALILGGCAETISDFVSSTRFTDPMTGKVIYERHTDAGSFARAPGNAAGPTTQSVTEQGVNASVSGVHAITPEQIVAQNQKALYWIGGGFFIVAVAGATILKSKPLAVGAGIAGVVCFAMPTFLNELRPYIPAIMFVGAAAFIAGCAWYLHQRHASNQSSKVAAGRFREGLSLAEQGKLVEALDRMRSGVDVLKVNKPVLAAQLDKAPK